MCSSHKVEFAILGYYMSGISSLKYRVTVGEVIENQELVTKDDIGHLPTKDEFYGAMDKVMGELKAIREEVAVLGHQVADHEDRIEKMSPN